MDTFPKKPPYFIITLDRHGPVMGTYAMFSQMFIPPVIPMIPAWHIGFATENMSRFGLGVDKWNDDVKADGQSICSVGNSPWPLIPHWNLFPYPGIPINPNIFIPLLIILSSSTNFLAVGSVIAKQGPVSVMIPGVKVIGTNLACNEPIPLPTDVVLFGQSTVVLGFTLGDLVAALVRWAIQIAIAFAFKFLGKVFGAIGKRFAGWVGRRLAGRFTSGLGAKVSNFLANLGRTGANKGPPGFLKRLNMNALNRLGLATRTRLPAATRGPFGALDRFFGQGYVDDFLRNRGFPVANRLVPGAFHSVADELVRAETELAKAVARKFGLPAAQDALGFGGPKPYTPSLADRFGSWLDGSSEMVNP
jgi:hypothetical protein